VILLDTSVWIETFRRGGLRLEEVAPLDEIATLLPIIQEVLQGFTDERAFRVARDAMFALPLLDAPVDRALFEEAVSLFRNARRAGLTVRSSVDCLIAACALRHDVEVVHRDRDFVDLARVSLLRQRRI
jgi:hypothetical protein